MIPLVLIISFILDSIISNFVPLHSIFMPLFILMALIIVYPYFNGNKARYYTTTFLTGLFYDLIYTNTIVIHAFLFLIIAFVITRLNLLLANNYVNVGIMAIICIIIYRSIAYGLLLITANIAFDWHTWFTSIYSSLLLNILYVIGVFILTDKISLKFKIHRSN